MTDTEDQYWEDNEYEPFPEWADRLNFDARTKLWQARIRPEDWARANYSDGEWHGDMCGCNGPCAGQHHDEGDDCWCLVVMIENALRDRKTGEEAAAAVMAFWDRGIYKRPDWLSPPVS